MEYTDNLGLKIPASSDEYNVDDFNYNFERIDSIVGDGKEVIAAAITTKGVDTSSSDSFTTMAENILSIEVCSGAPNIIMQAEADTHIYCSSESYSPE